MRVYLNKIEQKTIKTVNKYSDKCVIIFSDDSFLFLKANDGYGGCFLLDDNDEMYIYDYESFNLTTTLEYKKLLEKEQKNELKEEHD